MLKHQWGASTSPGISPSKMTQTSALNISDTQDRSTPISWEYGQFLSNLAPWSWFFTGTFRADYRGVVAVTQFRDWFRRWHHESALLQGGAWFSDSSRLCGTAIRRWRRGKKPQYILAVEPHRDRQGVHVHAVVSNPITFDLSWEVGTTLWKARHGWNKLERVRQPERSICYAMKYINKGGELHLSEGLQKQVGI